MSQNPITLFICQTNEEDWEILKTVRLESLLESPDVFSANYTVAKNYSELQWRDRASHKTPYHYVLALESTRAVGMIGWTYNSSQEFNVVAMWVKPEYRGQNR